MTADYLDSNKAHNGTGYQHRDAAAEDASARLKAAAVRDSITAAVRELCKSARGRTVARELYNLLDGPLSQLDQFGWDYVTWLMTLYRDGYPASVLSALREAT